ncbi:hypothetical protein ACWWUQ_02640 [Corynebacterium striatum]
MARRDPADKAKIDAIEKKLLANPDIAKLIDDLGTSCYVHEVFGLGVQLLCGLGV